MPPPPSEGLPSEPSTDGAGGVSAAPAQTTPLGKSVSADLEAVLNDLCQAKELACDYQRQLAGKANDHAMLKVLFEKTNADLKHLQNGIHQLREDRHRLANEVMAAAALQIRLENATRERDYMRGEILSMRAAQAEEAAVTAQLRREIELLRSKAPAAPRRASSPGDTGHKPERISVPFFDPAPQPTVNVVTTDPNGAAAPMTSIRR